MGKTALCDAVLVDAKRAGWRVAWTAATQASILPGLWPWRQLLGALDGGDLPPSSDGGDPAAARIAQFDAVARRVRDAATATPVLGVLDDAHWTDPATVAMLVHYAATARQSPGLPARDLPAGGRAAFVPARCGPGRAAQARQRGRARTAGPRRRRRAGGRARSGRARERRRRRAGRADAGQPAVRHRDGPPPRRPLAARLAELRVPPAITATITERVRRLPGDCREVLGLASAIGADFDGRHARGRRRPRRRDHARPARGRPSPRRSRRSAARAGSRSATRCSAPPCTSSSARRAGSRRTPASPRSSKRPATEPAVLAHHLAQSAPLGNAEAAARYAVAAGDAAMGRAGLRDRLPALRPGPRPRPARRRPRRSAVAEGRRRRRGGPRRRRVGRVRGGRRPGRRATGGPGPGRARPQRGCRDGGRPGRAVPHAAAPRARRGRRRHRRAAAARGSRSSSPPRRRRSSAPGWWPSRPRSPKRPATRSRSPTPPWRAATCTRARTRWTDASRTPPRSCGTRAPVARPAWSCSADGCASRRCSSAATSPRCGGPSTSTPGA